MHRSWLALFLAWLVVSFLCAEGRPESQLAQRLRQLISQLAGDDLEKQAEARNALERLGKRSIPALRDAAKGSKDPVTRERAGQLADMIDKLTSGELRGFLGHTMAVNAVAFSPDGRQLLSASTDQTMRLWDARTGQELRRSIVKSAAFMAAAFSPDGRRIVSGHWDHSVRLWVAVTGKEEGRLDGHEDFITSMAWSPDGKRVLSGSHDGYMRLWDVRTMKEVRSFKVGAEAPGKPGALEAVACLSISPDGKTAASAGGDPIASLWDLGTGKLRSSLPNGSFYTRSVVFSPDGRWLLTGDEEGLIRLWNVQTGKELRRFVGPLHTKDSNILGRNYRWAAVASLAFSPDGGRILSGHWDNTVRLWSANTGKELACFNWHFSDVKSVTFSPDGKWALSGSRDTTVRLWALPK